MDDMLRHSNSLKTPSASKNSRHPLFRGQSLAVAGLAVALSFYILQSHIDWWVPSLITMIFLALVGLNFLALAAADQNRQDVGKLTIPALVAFIFLSVVYLLAETVDRFVFDFGYDWLKPVVGLYAVFCAAAVFMDRKLPVQLLLAFNGIAVTALWNLCDSGKMSWMF